MVFKNNKLKYLLGLLVLITSILVGVLIGINNKPEIAVAKDETCKVQTSAFCEEITTKVRKTSSKKDYKTKQLAGFIGQEAPTTSNGGGSYVYSVQVRGSVRTSLSSFAASIAQTLADSRGWARKGTFSRGNSGSFIIVLTPAANVPSFSSACSSSWSCRVGPYVIINEDRWLGATSAWNSAGGSLRDYRHMVINHEVGHWLGHGHSSCPGTGQLAPLMQQQSISLQGCKFNPWPLPSEL